MHTLQGQEVVLLATISDLRLLKAVRGAVQYGQVVFSWLLGDPCLCRHACHGVSSVGETLATAVIPHIVLHAGLHLLPALSACWREGGVGLPAITLREKWCCGAV